MSTKSDAGQAGTVITLAMWALAFLAVTRAEVIADETKKQNPLLVLLPLSVTEIRRLLVRLISSVTFAPDLVFAWSHWRRCHQYRAKRAHYRKRGVVLPLYLRL